jgi:tRNA-dihydrouridine synthase
VPGTVKTRIGIDDQDSYDDLYRFVDIVAGGGAELLLYMLGRLYYLV